MILRKTKPVAKMPIRHELTGVSASPGFAIGPLWMPRAQTVGTYTPKDSPEREAIALEHAIKTACDEVAELLGTAKGQAAAILEFHLAVMSDDTFCDAALARIASGETAHQAWGFVLEKEIADYSLAADETFRARALDLHDIKGRVSRILCNQTGEHIPNGVIVLADNLTPTAFIAHDWQGSGIALIEGSTSSHVAILARQFSVPMLTNIGPLPVELKAGVRALLVSGADAGRLIVSPNAGDEKAAIPMPAANIRLSMPDSPLVTGDGKPVSLMINLARLRELDTLDAGAIDGIGLVRTEFLFEGVDASEETQFQAYCQTVNWAKGKPVFIRTIDAGGDKPVQGFTGSAQFSKLRGIRLSLSRPEVFRVQIRALLRAAISGSLHVTLPMVSTENDLNEALALFADEAQRLTGKNIAHAMPHIGIMVEVPGVAMTLERFARAAHFAIGTNDLIQYTLAQPRDGAGEKSGIDNPAIMALIKNIVSTGNALGKPVSVCGDAASDAASVTHLLGAGIVHFSVSPPARPLVIAAIRAYNAGGET
jgi:phosphoenolpyruvate-protein phosphotransferase (PTS system enzyme I)